MNLYSKLLQVTQEKASMKLCESVKLTKLSRFVSPIGEHFRSRKGFVVSFQFCLFLFSFLLPAPVRGGK